MKEIADRQVRQLFIEYWKNMGYTQEAASNCAKNLTIDEMKYQLVNAGYIVVDGGRTYRY